MRCKNEHAIVALAVMATASAAVGQVVKVGAPGLYGNPYGTMGLANTDTWEMYLYDSNPGVLPPVTVTPNPGNPTQVALGNVYLGPEGATGVMLFGDNVNVPSGPGFQTKDLLYLNNSIASNTTDWGTHGTDANGHGSFDLSIGFIDSPATWLANSANLTDNLSSNVSSGTTGLFLHYDVGNIGATQARQSGSPWVAQLFGGDSYGDGLNFIAPNAVNADTMGANTRALTKIWSGKPSTDCGTPYGGPMEVSEKMLLDPNTPGNWLLKVKMGNQVTTVSFNPTDPRFGAGGFNPQMATPVVYLGSADWNAGTFTQQIGILPNSDANADGRVNTIDLATFRDNFGATDATWSQGDFNQDGRVDARDLLILRASYNTNLTYTTASIARSALVKPLAKPMNQPAAGTINLVVDTTTGDVQLVGGNNVTLSIYEIDSASGSSIANNLNGLTNQGASGWSVFGHTNSLVCEATLGDGVDLSNGSIDLGDIYNTSGVQDLSLIAFDNNNNEVDGVVSYVPEPASLALVALSAAGLVARRRREA